MSRGLNLVCSLKIGSDAKFNENFCFDPERANKKVSNFNTEPARLLSDWDDFNDLVWAAKDCGFRYELRKGFWRSKGS